MMLHESHIKKVLREFNLQKFSMGHFPLPIVYEILKMTLEIHHVTILIYNYDNAEARCVFNSVVCRYPSLEPNLYGPRQANLVLIAYASSEGSGEPAHPRSLARTFAAHSYK